MAVTKITTDTFKKEVLESDVPVVVDFHADWCRPCHQISPILEMLSQEHEGVVAFVKVNIDEEPEIAQAYRISSIPAVLLFDSGAPKAWSLGAKPGYVLERELGLARVAKKARKKEGTHAEGDGTGRRKPWWGARGR